MAYLRRKLVLIVASGLVVGPLSARLPGQDTGDGSNRDAPGHDNLRNVALALHGDHDIYGHFPPAVLTGADGERHTSSL